MVPASVPRSRRLRRRAAADRQRSDNLPTAHRSAHDRSARSAPRPPRARDRHRLGLRNIETRLGDGAGGWPERAPFDRIIVTAAAPGVPTPLTEQLAPGGRLVIPVGDLSGQELVILQRGPEGSLTERHAGGVRFVPLISRLAFTEEPGA